MSGNYFIGADEDKGARWPFTPAQLPGIIAEIHPAAQVAGPDAAGDIDITLPGQPKEHTINYYADPPAFVFKEEDGIDATAGLVLQVLQRLAPRTPSSWFADFEGIAHPFEPADFTTAEFVRVIWEEL